ncbi:MAG: N-acetylmuramoyl-L-alanine amidase [Alphaproteobacteria bacterium]|nr:MAG: N-acetylmuramoyl-L-alanine amidase [Alphaproteobacteria bacterium]
MMISDAPSPNFNDRADGKKPSLLILHYTDTVTGFEALKILQSEERRVSSHYFVNDDGHIMRLVPEEMRAWHAGKSYWQGETDINSVSIGIEIQNPGHTNGYVAFPEDQIRAVTNLCREIIARNKILPYHVLAHSDIAPERKMDPGEFFPWGRLAGAGVGLWPNVTESIEADSHDVRDRDEEVRSLLNRYGYDPRVDFKAVVTAFQRHFEPEVFAEDRPGEVTIHTLRRLMALNKQRLALRPKTA